MRTLAILFWLVLSRAALAADPIARASIDDTAQHVPGQQIELVVEVFAPDFFTSPPQFPLFEIPDALVTFSSQRAQNVVQSLNGVQYSGIRQAYAVVPERPGAFTVPPIEIPLGWSKDGVPAKGKVETSPLSFEVTTSEQQGIAFAASGLEIRQSFDRDPSTLKAGDALVRTVVVTAAGTQSLAMPPVQFGPASGLKQYAKPPKLEDGIPLGRGDTVSRRTETIAYSVSAMGDYELPAVSYKWFDIDANSLSEAALPVVRLHVSEAEPTFGIPPATQITKRERSRHIIPMLIFVALAASFLVGWTLRHRVSGALKSICAARVASPRNRLRQLRKTIASGDPTAIYAALHTWSRERQFPTLASWARTQPELVGVEVMKLERTLFGGGRDDMNRKVLSQVRLPSASREVRTSVALPPLNPVEEQLLP